MDVPVQDSNALIEQHKGIWVIRPGAGTDHWSSVTYDRGLSGRTVQAKHLSMNVAYMPPGGVIEPHFHDGFEVGLYQLEGDCEYRFGPGLTERLVSGPGDFLLVEPGVPHAVYNLSETTPVITVVARTTPDEWDRIVPYDPAAAGLPSGDSSPTG